MFRTEIRLPDDLHDRLKRRAEIELRSLNSMMLIAIRMGLNEIDRREQALEDKP